MPPLLTLLALCNLVIGTGAFVISGILEPISRSLGVSVASTGQAMTAYALSTAVLAPALLIATGRWSRRNALLLALLLFALGNAVCALAPGLTTLLSGRVLMGLGAVFTPLAAGITIALVEPAKRGQALAFVFLGVSLSYVIGLPLGAWIGLRYGWRWPIAMVVVSTLVMLALLASQMPRDVKAPGASFAGIGGLLARPAVWSPLVMTLLYFTAIFCVFSYIGPVLKALNPISNETLSITLALFGIAGAIGTVLGGWATDRFGARPTLLVQIIALGTMMALVPLTAGHPMMTLAVFLAWGVAGFGMMAPQQARLALAAAAQAPLALSLNTSMLYGGTALGAAIGGAASGSLGFDRLSWIGVPFAAAALATLALGRTCATATIPTTP